MQALRIYSRGKAAEYPCRPCGLRSSGESTLVLGEGACVFAIEGSETAPQRSRGELLGFGFALEKITSATSISNEAEALELSMHEALENAGRERVDAVVLHAPGTQRGDDAELRAIGHVFEGAIPCIVSNKWKMGHTFGAAGAFGVETALGMLEGRAMAALPYPNVVQDASSRPAGGVRTVMVNAAGFGGNAVSIIVGR
jgi:3-oxoacyl-(acyl-carrier-protein) synthase